jgi:6-pyruvoyltetrahydropterin/6-carboxytetrahydropterin synthase
LKQELSLYRIFIETRFSSAHSIQRYDGPCGKLHGHTWKVRVEVTSQKTNELGLSIDFKDLKRISDSVVGRLDHQHINEIDPFQKENPTAENIARYLFREIMKKLSEDVRLYAVTVWESESTGVTYSENSYAENQ